MSEDSQPQIVTIPETPEEAVENQEAPGYVGTLEQDEFQMLRSLQQMSSQTVMKIGQLEVQKANLLASLRGSEQRAQAMMDRAAERFGVAPGQRWSVGPDGKVYAPGESE